MSAIPVQKTYTVEDYLALERGSIDGKCEFVDGRLFAMTGASREHNVVSINIAGELRSQLKGRPCEAYVNDMRVKAAAVRNYYYPDIAVVCGKPEFEDDHVDTLLNPAVLIEILSPSTESRDRGEKFANYRRIPSLRDYLLVSQDKPRIEHYRRQGEAWMLTETAGLEGTVNLETIGCVLPLREVYERVFSESSAVG